MKKINNGKENDVNKAFEILFMALGLKLARIDEFISGSDSVGGYYFKSGRAMLFYTNDNLNTGYQAIATTLTMIFHSARSNMPFPK